MSLKISMVFILLSLVHYSYADLAPNETIRGVYGERLDILCPLHFPSIAEQQIVLYINSRQMIIMAFKKTKTPAIHCTSDHPYKKMCQTQMMNSYADKNNVHFVIDKVPETLNDSTSKCGTDHDDLEKKTRRDPPRTIILRATQLDRILTHPEKVVYRDEGSNVSFEWNFQIGSWPNPRPKVVEFVFGEWAFPGYVRKKILYVQGHNQVHKRPGFEKKVDWMGNVYECVECTAEVVVYNLTLADFKSYGVHIELGVDRSPLTNSLRLVKRDERLSPNTSLPSSPSTTHTHSLDTQTWGWSTHLAPAVVVVVVLLKAVRLFYVKSKVEKTDKLE